MEKDVFFSEHMAASTLISSVLTHKPSTYPLLSYRPSLNLLEPWAKYHPSPNPIQPLLPSNILLAS